MTDEKRKGFLENLLGKKEADSVRETLTKAAKTLDDAKVARKEDPAVAAEAAAATPGVDEIAAAIGQMLTNAGLPDDTVNKVVEAVKAALAPPAEAAAEVATEYAEEVKTIVKSLGDLVESQTADNGLIAKAVVDIASAIKEIATDNAKLKADVAAIQRTVGDRPRQASKALETEVESVELAAKIKEGIEGDTTFLGIKVKPLATEGANGNGSKKGS